MGAAAAAVVSGRGDQDGGRDTNHSQCAHYTYSLNDPQAKNGSRYDGVVNETPAVQSEVTAVEVGDSGFDVGGSATTAESSLSLRGPGDPNQES
jgi:hypothetical protein